MNLIKREIVLLLFLSITSCNMHYKKYTSENGALALTLPVDWEEYDDGDSRTYAFFNAKLWTGNLRITPFRKPPNKTENENQAEKFISEEIEENEGAKRIKLGNFDCAYYKKDIVQDGEAFVIYYWALGKGNELFICSFTIDKAQENKKENERELNIVEDILKSIKKNTTA